MPAKEQYKTKMEHLVIDGVRCASNKSKAGAAPDVSITAVLLVCML